MESAVINENICARDIKNYLNHLSQLKNNAKPPISLEIKDGLYHVMDGDGIPVLLCSKKIYDIFQEL